MASMQDDAIKSENIQITSAGLGGSFSLTFGRFARGTQLLAIGNER